MEAVRSGVKRICYLEVSITGHFVTHGKVTNAHGSFSLESGMPISGRFLWSYPPYLPAGPASSGVHTVQ